MLEKLIHDYRMQGFDNPEIVFDTNLKCFNMKVSDPCAVWTFVKGPTEEKCVLNGIYWYKKNKNFVGISRKKLIDSYMAIRRSNRTI